MACLEQSTFTESPLVLWLLVHSPACLFTLVQSVEEDGNISVYSCFSGSYQGHVSVIVERPTNIYRMSFSNPPSVGRRKRASRDRLFRAAWRTQAKSGGPFSKLKRCLKGDYNWLCFPENGMQEINASEKML